eukprot:g2768.t1
MSLAHMRFGENPEPAPPAEKAALKEGRQLLAEVLKVSEALNNASVRYECMKMNLQVCIQDEDVVEARKVLAQLQDESLPVQCMSCGKSPRMESSKIAAGEIKSRRLKLKMQQDAVPRKAHFSDVDARSSELTWEASEGSSPAEMDLPEGFPIDPLPSVGSAMHHAGECRPCAWFWKRGCLNGRDCLHCHLCPEGSVRQKKADKDLLWRGFDQSLRPMRAPGVAAEQGDIAKVWPEMMHHQVPQVMAAAMATSRLGGRRQWLGQSYGVL